MPRPFHILSHLVLFDHLGGQNSSEIPYRWGEGEREARQLEWQGQAFTAGPHVQLRAKTSRWEDSHTPDAASEARAAPICRVGGAQGLLTGLWGRGLDTAGQAVWRALRTTRCPDGVPGCQPAGVGTSTWGPDATQRLLSAPGWPRPGCPCFWGRKQQVLSYFALIGTGCTYLEVSGSRRRIRKWWKTWEGRKREG